MVRDPLFSLSSHLHSSVAAVVGSQFLQSLTTATKISSLIGLVALLATLYFWFRFRKFDAREKELNLLPDHERAKRLNQVGSDFGLPVDKLTAAQIHDLLIARMRLTRTLVIVAAVALLICFLTAIITESQNHFPEPPLPSVVVGRTPTGEVQIALRFDVSGLPHSGKLRVEFSQNSSFDPIIDQQELKDWSAGQVLLQSSALRSGEYFVRLRLFDENRRRDKSGDPAKLTILGNTP